MMPHANHGDLERAEQEIQNLRAQLRREQDARAELRIEHDSVKAELDAAWNATGVGPSVRGGKIGVRLSELVAKFKCDRDQARRELVAAMQTIEAASVALGGPRAKEQLEQPGEIDEVDRGDPVSADRAVVAHLVRLIQDNADVRYYVGGPHTRMRELLVEAIAGSGFNGDPLDALRPPPHRAGEEARVQLLARDCDRLEEGVEAIREALLRGDRDKALRIATALQAGERAA